MTGTLLPLGPYLSLDEAALRAIYSAALWLPALIGLGSLAPVAAPPPMRAPIRGLLGLGVLGALGLALNLAVPLGPQLALAVFSAGWALFAWPHAVPARRGEAALVGVRVREPLVALATAAALAIATRPPIAQYDNGLYHLQALRWAEAARALPGTALLHHRLGVPSVWPLACALLELPGRGSGSSAGFANLLPAALLAWAAVAALRLPATGSRYPAWALAAGALALFALQLPDAGSLGPDNAQSILAYTALVLWALALAVPAEEPWAVPAAWLCSLAALLLKPAAVAIFAGSSALAVWRARRLPPRSWRAAAIAGGAALALWLTRGLILSGCAFYPSSATCLPLPWAAPQQARELTDLVRAWARAPREDPAQVLAGWGWLGTWLRSNVRIDWLRPWAVALLAGFALLAAARRRPPAALLAPWLVGLGAAVFWFLAAPDLRFGFAALLALALLPLAAGLAWAPAPAVRTLRAAALAAGLLTTGWLAWRRMAEIGPHDLFQPGPVVMAPGELSARLTAGGLPVYVPMDGDQCWDAPLPCTPYFEPRLAWSGRYFTLLPTSP